jgi:PPM family protein phosphatase
MRLSSFAATDVGLQRAGNEDSHLRGRTVFAVADGLGGHQGGEVASAMAVERLGALDGRSFAEPTQAAAALADAIADANRAILERGVADQGLWGMGTTVTAAAVVRDPEGRPSMPGAHVPGPGGSSVAPVRRRYLTGPLVLQLAHVGDSRAYLLRGDGPPRQLTTDHTVVAELVRRGRLTPQQAASHPERSILTRAVGLDPNVQVEQPAPLGLQPGDQVLLCSDGLTETVADEQLAQVLAGQADGDDACQALIAAANAAGGPDNITVVLLRVAG